MIDVLRSRCRCRTRVAADLVRLAGAASLLVSTPRGFVATALFALVLLGLTVPLVVRAPALLDLAYSTVLLLAAWGSILDYYLAHAWLDLVAHALVTALVSLMAYHLLAQYGLTAQPHDTTAAHPRLGALIVTTCLGFALGVLWEVGEWYGHTYLDPRIQTGYDDTIADLITGGLGTLFVAAPVFAWAATRAVAQLPSTGRADTNTPNRDSRRSQLS